MIDRRYLICTECLKQRRRKPRRYSSLKNLNLHLAAAHRAPYRVRVAKSALVIARVKRRQLKNHFV